MHLIGQINSIRGMGLTVYVMPPTSLIPNKQLRTHEKIEVFAIIDCGSSYTVVSPDIIKRLKLPGLRQVWIHQVGKRGPERNDLYLANFLFRSESDEIELENIEVQGMSLAGQPCDSLIGLNVLAYSVLTFIGPIGMFSLSF